MAKGGSVEETLMTTIWSSLCASRKAQVGLNLLERGAGGVGAVDLGHLGELADGGTGSEDGARLDIGFPGFELAVALGENSLVEDAGALVQLTDGLAEAGLADFVSADNELPELVEIDSVEQRQGRHERSGVGQPASQGRQTQRGRAAHSAAGADQPQSRFPHRHEKERSCQSAGGGSGRSASGIV